MLSALLRLMRLCRVGVGCSWELIDSYHSASALVLNVSGLVHWCGTRLVFQDDRNHPGASIPSLQMKNEEIVLKMSERGSRTCWVTHNHHPFQFVWGLVGEQLKPAPIRQQWWRIWAKPPCLLRWKLAHLSGYREAGSISILPMYLWSLGKTFFGMPLPLPLCAAGTLRDMFSYILATAGSKGDSASLMSPSLSYLRKKKKT